MKKVICVILIQLLAIYAYSFLFMLEGHPARHNSFTLQVLAYVCIGVFFLAPVPVILWAALKHKDEAATPRDK